MAVKKLSTCRHQSSVNKTFIMTNVCMIGRAPEVVQVSHQLSWPWISNGTLRVYEFHMTRRLLCWASRGGVTNSLPTPCPLHGHLLYQLVCLEDNKLYPIIQSISWLWWNWGHVTISPVEISYKQLSFLERYTLRAAIVVQVIHQYVSIWHWRNRVHTTIKTVKLFLSLQPCLWLTRASTSRLASFSPVCVLMAVKKLSTCRHQYSKNKIFITTDDCRMGIF